MRKNVKSPNGPSKEVRSTKEMRTAKERKKKTAEAAKPKEIPSPRQKQSKTPLVHFRSNPNDPPIQLPQPKETKKSSENVFGEKNLELKKVSFNNDGKVQLVPKSGSNEDKNKEENVVKKSDRERPPSAEPVGTGEPDYDKNFRFRQVLFRFKINFVGSDVSPVYYKVEDFYHLLNKRSKRNFFGFSRCLWVAVHLQPYSFLIYMTETYSRGFTYGVFFLYRGGGNKVENRPIIEEIRNDKKYFRLYPDGTPFLDINAFIDYYRNDKTLYMCPEDVKDIQAKKTDSPEG